MGTEGTQPSRDVLPMTVKNMTFLVDRLGEDCAPLQFIRELTQNSIDAARASQPCLVVWNVDWAYYRLTGVRELACIDTGQGMTGAEMVSFINELSSSIHEQSASGNFGVGAKIAAAPRNPHATQKDHRKAILERLRQIHDLLRFKQYVPNDSGGDSITPEEAIPGGEAAVLGRATEANSPSGKKGGSAGEVYGLFAETGDVAADEVSTITEPQTKWVSVEDQTRSHGDMEDRAAKYLRDQNLLVINSDFRVFTEMVRRWEAAYGALAGSGPVVKEVGKRPAIPS